MGKRRLNPFCCSFHEKRSFAFSNHLHACVELKFLDVFCQIRPVFLCKNHYLTMARSAVGRSEVCVGEYTGVLNSTELGTSPVAYGLSSIRTSILRSWAVEPPIESLVCGILKHNKHNKKWNKACLLFECGRKNTDFGVRLSRVKSLVLPFPRFLALDTWSDSFSSSLERH